MDIEDFPVSKTTPVENIEILKNMILDLYNLFDDSKTQSESKKQITKQYHKLSNKYSKEHKIKVKKADLVYVYSIMIKENEIELNEKFQKCLQKKPRNGQSGVHPVTIMFPPKYTVDGVEYEFTCKHDCLFCPNHPHFPRSYLPGAPAPDRGMSEDFDSIKQMNNNIERLIRNGHIPDKFDLIFEGGTLQDFDPKFLLEYFTECYYAANTYFSKVKRPMMSIQNEVEFNNKHSRIKIIGLCVETRPDNLINENGEPNEFWFKLFRDVGVTRVQLGVTHTNDYLLKRSNRGHTYECSVIATSLLKKNGFKVAHHYMPALPYSTPEMDFEMFKTVYSSTDGRPHEIKIYPYSVVPYSTFKTQYDNNKFTLYSETNPEEYMKVMEYGLKNCPEDIRIARAIRDFPNTVIYGGNTCPNLRQVIETRLDSIGDECKDIRSREISRRDNYELNDAVYDVKKLNSNEYFISCISKDRRALFGFLRLRLNNRYDYFTKDIVFKELLNTAIVQELHVYCKDGILVPVGKKINSASQHKGVGKTLLLESEKIALMNGYTNIAVISGEGVRDYYEKNGYTYSNHSGRFMMNSFMKFYYIVIMVIIIVFKLIF